MLTFKLFVMTVSLNCFGNTSFNYNDDEDRLFNVSTSVFGLLKVVSLNSVKAMSCVDI